MRLSWIFRMFALAALGTFEAVAAPPQTAPQRDAPPGQTLVSKLPRTIPAGAARQDVEQLISNNSEFALDLYHALRRENEKENLFFSPYSLSLALAMTYAGARGETAAQMAKTLRFALPPERLHPSMNELDQRLASRTAGGEKPESPAPFRLNVVNRLWIGAGEPVLPAYLDLLAQQYGAGVSALDFSQSAEAAAAMNQWVARETENRIRDLMTKDDVKRAVLVLTNAIYFKAAWEKPFSPEATRPAAFHPPAGPARDVPMMQQKHNYAYAAGDGWQAVELAYAGHEAALLVLVPDAGRFAEVEAAFQINRLREITTNLRPRAVLLKLPKFSFSSKFNLAQTLEQMGMPLAFGPKADFSGMNGKLDLFIGKVIHQAFVLTDEAGTEAAAATAVIMERKNGGAHQPPLELIIDRPFLFLVRDLRDGAILFLGRVLNP